MNTKMDGSGISARLLVCVVATLFTIVQAGRAQEPQQSRVEWGVRVFQVPLDHGIIIKGEFPPASAGKGEWEEYLKVSTDGVGDLFKSQGIPMPEGSAALFDATTGTLVARFPKPCLDLAEAYVDELWRMQPRELVLTQEVWETDETDMSSVLEVARTEADVSSALARWKSILHGKPSAKKLGELRFSTVDGTWARAEHVGKPHAEAVPQGTVASPRRTSIEAKPVAHADGIYYDMEYRLEIGAATKEEQAALPRTLGLSCKSTITFKDGTTRLLGVWRKPGTGDVDERRMEAAFLKMQGVVPKRGLNILLESKFRNLVSEPAKSEVLESGGTLHKKKTPSAHTLPHIPPGIQTRAYPVPGDFFVREQETSTPVAPDPFAPSVFQRSRTTELFPRLSGEAHILHSGKMPFPEGTRGVFVHEDSALVIASNSECHRLIAEYLSGCWKAVPRTMVFTVSLFEADAAVVQEIADATPAGTVETAMPFWKNLLANDPEARVVEQQRLEAIPGAFCEIQWHDGSGGQFELAVKSIPNTSQTLAETELAWVQADGPDGDAIPNAAPGMKMNAKACAHLPVGASRLMASWTAEARAGAPDDRQVRRAIIVRVDSVPLDRPKKFGSATERVLRIVREGAPLPADMAR